MKSCVYLSSPAPTGEDRAFKDGWNSALPIGNGSIGGMVYGDPSRDILQINEDTVWYGSGGRNRVNPLAKDNWKKCRDLLVEGRISEAEKLCEKTLYAIPDQQRHYDTCGHISLNFSHDSYDCYRRELDLENAVCRVEFSKNGKRFEREYFVSNPDQVIAIRQRSIDGAVFNAEISIVPPREEYEGDICEVGNFAVVQEPEGGCRYCVMLAADWDGFGWVDGLKTNITDSTEITVYITVRSDFYGDDILKWCEEKLKTALSLGYEGVKARHIEDYRRLYDRVSIELDGEDRSEIPTNERLKCAESDPQLAKLYFDFGRYLLISSSRPGTRPANLQGIWNKDLTPAWGSKYTININAEMNYWPAGVCDLSECEMPLLEHLKTMLPYGKKVAMDMYGLEGFCAHHNTDIFGDCAPQDWCMTATVWPMGAAWLCTHIKSHYEFTGDTEFLREYIDILKEACRFFTGYLFEKDGKLLTGPSISPENTYIHPSGERGSLCIGPTMDSMIIREIFESCLEYSALLGVEDELCEKIREMLPKLPKPTVGKYGQIMEWAEDYDEAEPGHRHISHLWGLHPSNQLTFETTPELMDAARVTLERRLSHGGGHTGWSRAWIINMWARLRDGEKAVENVEALLKRSTYPNFFDMHPPFQIDGNFGGAAGIAEMLLQSQDGVITLLPALPKKWASGRVHGLKARGNITVDFEWNDGKVTHAKFVSNLGNGIKTVLPDGAELKLIGAHAVCTSDRGVSEFAGDEGYVVEYWVI